VDLQAFLKELTLQTQRFGKKNLEIIADFKSDALGFKSPLGTCCLPISKIQEELGSDPIEILEQKLTRAIYQAVLAGENLRILS